MESIALPLSYFSKENFLSLCDRFAEVPCTHVLYSGGGYTTSLRSYLAIFPIKNIVIMQEDPNPWEILKSSIGVFTEQSERIPKWFGFISYPMGQTSDEDKVIPMMKTSFPLAQFHLYSYIFTYDHQNHSLQLYWEKGKNDKWISTFQSLGFWKDIKTRSLHTKDTFLIEKGIMGKSRLQYNKKISDIFDLIRRGIVYQLNYSHKFVLRGHKSPFSVFLSLIHKNPSPFSSYYYSSHFSIVSSSPELFLKKEERILETRPIKGTAKRGKTKKSDVRNYNYLMESEKECSELAMITDLMRNDLGKISEIGSVRVVEAGRIEAYTNVFQKFSIVQSYVKKNLHSVDVVRACFPGGSITGCPKLKAMETINTIEQESRDIYTGSIGIFFANGDFIFNVAIRTVLFQNDIITFRLGGGIVIDSIPEQEYLETIAKGESILQSLL